MDKRDLRKTQEVGRSSQFNSHKANSFFAGEYQSKKKNQVAQRTGKGYGKKKEQKGKYFDEENFNPNSQHY